MKIKLELFGASRDFSDNDHLEIKVQDKASLDDLRNEIIKYIDENIKIRKIIKKFFTILNLFVYLF